MRGVAGDEQYLQFGLGHTTRIRDLPTVQPTWQAHFRDEQINALVGLQEGDTRRPVAGGEDAVACITQEFADEVADCNFVLHISLTWDGNRFGKRLAFYKFRPFIKKVTGHRVGALLSTSLRCQIERAAKVGEPKTDCEWPGLGRLGAQRYALARQ